MESPLSQTIAPTASARSAWINGARWDLGWLIGSALIVPLVLLFVWVGSSSNAVNLGVTVAVGGPHLFATYTATYMDPSFRRSHVWLLVVATIVVPVFVVYWALVDFQILLSVFIFAASVHILHQNAYLTDIYRKRVGRPEPSWSRLVDYGLLMVCIYPIAAYKLVRGNFFLGEVEILIPSLLRTAFTYWLVWIVFTSLLAVWIGKSVREHRAGVLNLPKTILIGATTLVAFLVPMAASGQRMELAFQAVNAWHSFQYLGIVWFIQKVRKERGQIESPLIRKMSGGGRASWYFYGFCLAVTLVLLGVLMVVIRLDPIGLASEPHAGARYYYMGVLSCLLIHYVLDGFLFTVSNRSSADPARDPYAVPAAA